MIVPNQFPVQKSALKLALIGEAPGADEDLNGKPFCGVSGRFLAALLTRAGIPKEACFLGNVCQYKPPGNNFSLLEWDSLQVQHGLNQLREDLQLFSPNIVVLLGNVPLKAAKDIHGKSKKFLHSNANWRGSLFLCDSPASPMHGFKCMATYHPAYCLRVYKETPMLQLDLRKAVREAAFPHINKKERKLLTGLTEIDLLSRMMNCRFAKQPIAIDIEGYYNDMSCISIATSDTEAFIVPFRSRDYKSLDTWRIWRGLSDLLEDENVPKILQNSLYDRFVLYYGYGIWVRNVLEDTMLKHWELYSELEKALDVQASIYTDQPYYKQDRKAQDDKTFFEYCCTDSAVTKEICDVITPQLKEPSKRHYSLNIELLNPMLYMEMRGIRYDIQRAAERRAELRRQMFVAQALLNAKTGNGFRWQSHEEINSRVRELMWFKNGKKIKKKYEEPIERLKELANSPNPDLATVGEIETICEVHLNVESSKGLISFLYEKLLLPVQYKETPTGEKVPTADYEALLNLCKILKQQKESDKTNLLLSILQDIIVLRSLSTRQQMLSINADPDGRIRCGYNIVGTNTGRISCYESPTGSGYNLQTIPNYTSESEAPGGVLGDRDLFLSDTGNYFFQCDLSGADGWTVAAYSAMLGDPTMLLDYRAGVSPFKILTLMLRGLEVPKDRNDLREAVKVIHKDAWDRFAMKRVQHGGSYLEGPITVSRNIFKDSEGKLYIAPAECKQMLNYYFSRYPGVKKWQDWIANRINPKVYGKSELTAASGQIRQFFGRPEENVTKAVAFEPQANTTYATNLAMHKLWTDPENRYIGTDGKVHLWIEPLHQVHDALCGQFPIRLLDWASKRIKYYFHNVLQIAGQEILIPYEGGYGPSWGNLEIGKL